MSTWEKESIGSNESGKKDLFGGPVVVAVYLNKKILKKLKSRDYFCEIKESKKYSDKWINEITPKIIKTIGSDNYTFIEFTAEQYNSYYSKFKNVNIILSYMHNYVHKKLDKDAYRIVNAFTTLNNHYSYLKEIGICEYCKIDNFKDKAKLEYLSCTLAFIIARYLYIKQIKKLSKNYKVEELPKGNSFKKNSVIDAYKKLLMVTDDETIKAKICKSNFKTLEVIKKRL